VTSRRNSWDELPIHVRFGALVAQHVRRPIADQLLEEHMETRNRKTTPAKGTAAPRKSSKAAPKPPAESASPEPADNDGVDPVATEPAGEPEGAPADGGGRDRRGDADPEDTGTRSGQVPRVVEDSASHRNDRTDRITDQGTRVVTTQDVQSSTREVEYEPGHRLRDSRTVTTVSTETFPVPYAGPASSHPAPVG